MPKFAREPFSQRLVRIRKAKGLSQYDLAEASGISQRMIAHYETRIKNPAPETVIRLAKTLKVSIDELMGYKAIKNKQELSRWVLRKAKMLDELSLKDKKAVTQMIDSLHGGRKA